MKKFIEYYTNIILDIWRKMWKLQSHIYMLDFFLFFNINKVLFNLK